MRSRVRVNQKAAFVLIAAVVLAALGYLGLARYQTRRLGRIALDRARALAKSDAPELALQHLDQYLASRPDDLEAIRLQARLLHETARDRPQMLQAARKIDHLLRSDPTNPDRRGLRRQLVQLYLRSSDVYKAQIAGLHAPEYSADELRYRAAAVIAAQLAEPRPGHPSTDAIDHRLYAMALEGSLGGDDPRTGRAQAESTQGPKAQETLNQAVAQYQEALKLDPRDMESAYRLALIDWQRRNLPEEADRVIDGLKDHPDQLQARRLRARYFAFSLRPKRAQAELDEAARLAPENTALRLEAAGFALERGDVVGARAQLAKIPPETARRDLKVQFLLGQVEYAAEHQDEAIADWFRGLEIADGSDADLAWFLAFAQLARGYVAEANPLIERYRQLSGNNDDDPRYKLLVALRHEIDNETPRAIAELERLRSRETMAGYRDKIETALGRCYAALSDVDRAREAFRQAISAAPTAIEPRIRLAELVANRRPDEAIAELERGFKETGNATILVAIARAQMVKELKVPAAKRSWTDYDRTMARLQEAGISGGSQVVALRANRLSLGGHPDQALALFEKAVAADPKQVNLWAAWAEALIRLGRPAEALKVLERAENQRSGGQARLRIVHAGILLRSMGRGRDAEKLLLQGIDARTPAEQAMLWQAIGRMRASQGELSRAREAFAAALAARPDDPRPKLAILQLAINSRDSKLIHNTVLNLKPPGEAWKKDNTYRLAHAMELIHEVDPKAESDDRIDQAERLVDSVILDARELAPAHLFKAQLLDRRAQVMERHKADSRDEINLAYRRALDEYRLAWDHEEPAALPRLIELLVQQKRFDDLADLKERGDTFRGIDRLSAEACLRFHDAANGIRFVRQAASGTAEDAGLWSWEAAMYSQFGLPDEAEKVLRRRVDAHSDDPTPWLVLLQYQARRRPPGNTAATLEEAKRKVRTDRPELLEARCLAAMGDRAGADRAFNAALRKRPDDVETLLTAAEFALLGGRLKDARDDFRRVLDRDPRNRAAARQLALLQSSVARDLASWRQAWALLGAEGDEAPEDRLGRAIVLARCPDPKRRAEAIAVLEALVDDLPSDSSAATIARELLIRSLLEVKQADRARRVAAVSASLNNANLPLYIETLLQTNDLDEAGRQLDLYAQRHPGDRVEARYRLRLAQLRAADPEAGVEAVEKTALDRVGKPDEEIYGREAFALLFPPEAKADDRAERIARGLARRAPETSWMLAKVLARRRRFDEALATCRAAAEAPRGDLEDRVEAARAAIDVGQHFRGDAPLLADAAAIAATCHRLGPDVQEVAVLLAMLRHLQGDYAEEVRLYRSVLDQDPDNETTLNNLAWALSEGLDQPEEALTFANRCVERSKRAPMFLDTRGVILLRLKRTGEAVGDLEEAARAVPAGPFLYHLARAYHEAGREEDFRKTLDRARKAGLTADALDAPEREGLVALLKL